MKLLGSLAVCLVVIVTHSNACSPPIGGFREPGPEQLVHFASHVVLGEVTSLMQVDPMYADMYSTYGAMVTVQCSYKGGPVPGRIRIGAVGFIPGLCTSKDLEADKTYILFLDGHRKEDGDVYTQTETALPSENITNILNVCDLKVTYPQDNGITLKRKTCPPATQLPTCLRYKDEPYVGPTLPTPEQLTTTARGNQPSGNENQVGESRGDTGNGVASTTASFVLLLVSGLSWVFH